MVFVDADDVEGQESSGFVDADDKPVRPKKDKEKLQDMSVLGQATSGAVGGPEAVVSMGSQFAGMAVGGVAALGKGAHNLVTKGFVDADDMKKTVDTVADKMTYEPRSAAGKEFVEGLGHLYEGARDLSGRGAEAVSGGDSNLARTAGEFGFDVALNVAPLGAGLRTSKKARTAKERAIVEAEAVKAREDAMLSEPSSVRNRPESEALFEPRETQGKPGEFISEDGRVLVQEPYDPGMASKLTEQDYLGPRHKENVPPETIEFERVGKTEPTNPAEAGAKLFEQNYADRWIKKIDFEIERLRDEGGHEVDIMRLEEKKKELLDPSKDVGAGGGRIKTEFYNDELRNFLLDTQNVFVKGVEGQGNPNRRGLEIIKEKSTSPYYKELAKKLLEDPEFKPDFFYKGQLSDPNWMGVYETYKHKTGLRLDYLGDETTFLHENVHARTHAALEAFSRKFELSKLNEGEFKGEPPIRTDNSFTKRFGHLEAPVRRIYDLFESLKKETDAIAKELTLHNEKFPEGGVDAPMSLQLKLMSPEVRALGEYGLTNIHEFVAEGFTTPQFQVALANIPLPKALRTTTLRTYWDAFLDSISKLFGFKGKEQTYLSELLRAGSDLMSGMDKEARIYHADQMDGMKDLGSVKREVEKKGIMGSAIEQVRDFKLDRRPIKEVVDQVKKEPVTDLEIKEGSLAEKAMNRLGNLVKENLLQDTTIALLSKDPLIKWTVDQVSRIDREFMVKAKEIKDLTLTPYRRMFWDSAKRKELSEGMQIYHEHSGVRDLTRADFKTDRQWEVYESFQKANAQILKNLNELRVKHGMKPISRIPSYFHHTWEGDYRVFGFDGLGEKKWAVGAKTEAGAQHILKELQKAHPELKWEQGEVVKDKYGLRDLSSFEDAMRVMSADDPVTKALHATYKSILQHRGFAKSGLHRKGVLGAMGLEGGLLGLKNSERAFEQYVTQAHRYMGNLEKQGVLESLQEIPLEMRKQMPKKMDFLFSYLQHSKGVVKEMWIDEAMGQLTRAIGIGESAPRNFIHDLSQVATIFWLTTPRFLAAQTVQSINALPKLIQERGVVDGSKMFFEGWKNTLTPDSLAKEGLEWASKRQYLDPTITNLVGKNIMDVPTGNRFQRLKEWSSLPAAWVEHNLVRTPVFLMFEKALRDTIKDKELRFEEAAEKTDYYMVNYGRTHAPMIYGKLGNLGEAARPLKQYSHNYMGQFIEYAANAKNKHEYAPLAAFFATQVSVAGLKGAMFVGEAAVIITALNAMFDMDIPTPEQLLLKTSINDAFIYGGMSKMLGVDISSSVSAPGLPSLFTVPPIEFTKGLVNDVGDFALKFMKGTETDHDRLRAWLAITPNVLHEPLKQLYTGAGQPMVNPNDSQLRGNYRRSADENTWSAMMGAKPLPEAKADALMRNVKKELYRDLQQKLDATDAIVDRVQNKKPITPELIQRYIQNGGDPSRIAGSIADRIKQRYQTGPERIQDGEVTPSQAHRIQKLFEYIKENEPREALKFDPTTGELVYQVSPISDRHFDAYKTDKQIKEEPRKYNDTTGPFESQFAKGINKKFYPNSVYQRDGGYIPEEEIAKSGTGDIIRRPRSPEENDTNGLSLRGFREKMSKHPKYRT